VKSLVTSRWSGAVGLVLMTAILGVYVDPGSAARMGLGWALVIGLMTLSAALNRYASPEPDPAGRRDSSPA
jgi:hypothetical protein